MRRLAPLVALLVPLCGAPAPAADAPECRPGWQPLEPPCRCPEGTEDERGLVAPIRRCVK